MGNLPEKSKKLSDFEKYAGFSDYVLARVNGFHGVRMARYSHGLGAWLIDGLSGDEWDVIEWWPLPEYGTGNKPWKSQQQQGERV